jgi:hypothetical protein
MALSAEVFRPDAEHFPVPVGVWIVAGDTGHPAFGKREVLYLHCGNNVYPVLSCGLSVLVTLNAEFRKRAVQQGFPFLGFALVTGGAILLNLEQRARGGKRGVAQDQQQRHHQQEETAVSYRVFEQLQALSHDLIIPAARKEAIEIIRKSLFLNALLFIISLYAAGSDCFSTLYFLSFSR